jgi:tryptophan-rich sensory protein
MRQDFGHSRDFAALAVFLTICLGVMAIGGAITSTTVGTWYQTLAKPAFAPPDWVFGPVWTTLYIMMAIAGWLAWRRAGLRNPALSLFFAQLALNLAWSGLFFGMRWIGLAFIEILILWIAIAMTMRVFWGIDRIAAVLFVPYLVWVGYAAALNGAIWAINGQPFP